MKIAKVAGLILWSVAFVICVTACEVKKNKIASLDEILHPNPTTTSTSTTSTTLPGTTLPVAVVILSPAANPYASGETSFTLSGNCQALASVDMTGDLTQNTTCSAGGSFSFNISKAVDSSYAFQFKQTDGAGNISPTTNFTWNRNTLVPAPVITTPATSPYSSNLNSLIISGTCLSGNSVIMTGNSTQTHTCASNAFSFTVNSLVDGTFTYNIVQQDIYLNNSSSVGKTWIRDTLSPNAPVILAPTANPYTSADSSFSLSGSCETGASVILTGAQSSSSICASSSFSFNISQAVDGTYNYSVKQTDASGNNSTSTAFQWIRDTSVPTTPVISSPASSPVYSNLSSLTISGSCTSGDDVLITGDFVSIQTCSSSNFSFDISKSTDNTYNFSISQRNPLTMMSSAVVSQIWVRDSVSPAALTKTFPISNSTYTSNNLVISGTCEINATVYLTGDDSQNLGCASGNYSFTIIKSIDGTYNFSLSQTDRSGNTSTGITQIWIRDSSIPAAPTITTPNASPTSTNLNSLTLSGSCVSGFTVSLFGDVTASDVTSPAGSLTQTCISSSYTYSIYKMSSGTYNFSVKQTSLSAVDSSASAQIWNLDLIAPNTTLTLTPTNPNLGTSASFSFSSTEAGIFQCSLDGAAYATCSSPKTLSGLANGSHTFNVRAIDAVGNIDASPASYTWTQLSGKTLALYHLDSANPVLDSGSYTSPYQNNLTDSSTTNNNSGKFSQGRSFNGTSQHLSAPHSASLAQDLQTMTVEAFTKLASLPPSRYPVVAKMGSSGQYAWDMGVKKQGGNYRIYFIGSLDGTTTTEVTSANLSAAQKTALTSGYSHIAVTWNKGTVNLYMDGASLGSGTIGTVGSASLFDNSSTPVQIGTNLTNYLSGSIDEVRISQVVRWSTAFTPPTAAYTAD